MNIFKLSEEAFVTMGACSQCKQPFGITVDRADTRHSEYVFVWSFKINAEQAHREGYDSKNVQKLIEENYLKKQSEKNKQRYMRIVEFNDNKNTERLIEYLKRDHLI